MDVKKNPLQAKLELKVRLVGASVTSSCESGPRAITGSTTLFNFSWSSDNTAMDNTSWCTLINTVTVKRLLSTSSLTGVSQGKKNNLDKLTIPVSKLNKGKVFVGQTCTISNRVFFDSTLVCDRVGAVCVFKGSWLSRSPLSNNLNKSLKVNSAKMNCDIFNKLQKKDA